jgi:hypothetical protein
LSNECGDPYCVVDGVGEKADKNIALAMDFASVDFVEQRHHDE